MPTISIMPKQSSIFSEFSQTRHQKSKVKTEGSGLQSSTHLWLWTEAVWEAPQVMATR